MRNGFAAAVAAFALALVPAGAGATHSNGKGPNEDMAFGTGQGPFATGFGVYPAQGHINAKGTAADADGSFYLRIAGTPAGDLEFRGRVTCVNANGNTAVWRGVVTRSNTPLVPPGAGILNTIVDNGSGSGSPPDESGGVVTPPPTQPCPATGPATMPLEQGNLEVHDGI